MIADGDDCPCHWRGRLPPFVTTARYWPLLPVTQVSVMLVNYKGRPWMRGATENVALLYSLAACVAGVVVAAWELVRTATRVSIPTARYCPLLSVTVRYCPSLSAADRHFSRRR